MPRLPRPKRMPPPPPDPRSPTAGLCTGERKEPANCTTRSAHVHPQWGRIGSWFSWMGPVDNLSQALSRADQRTLTLTTHTAIPRRTPAILSPLTADLLRCHQVLVQRDFPYSSMKMLASARCGCLPRPTVREREWSSACSWRRPAGVAVCRASAHPARRLSTSISRRRYHVHSAPNRPSSAPAVALC
jgi:hypothetical protein